MEGIPGPSPPPGVLQYSNIEALCCARIIKHLRSPRIDSKESIPPAYGLAGRYDNPIPSRFLVLIDCLKIPSLDFRTIYGLGLGTEKE
jgi:hypothetical protein